MSTSENDRSEPRDLVVRRVFDAPLERVWNAWTQPEQVKRWWCPNGFTCPVAEMDVREGGTSLVCMRAPPEFGGQDMYSTWRYEAIVPQQRIEYVHNLADAEGNRVAPEALGLAPDFPQDVRNVVTFRDAGDGRTELVVTEYGYLSDQWFDLSKAGLEQCLDKMAASVER